MAGINFLKHVPRPRHTVFRSRAVRFKIGVALPRNARLLFNRVKLPELPSFQRPNKASRYFRLKKVLKYNQCL